MVRSVLIKDELDRAVRKLEYTRKNLDWITDNFPTLKKMYPDEYIAVCDRRVVVSGTRKRLVRERAMGRVRDPDCLTIKRIETKKRTLIL